VKGERTVLRSVMGFVGVYTAVYDYQPQAEGELDIREGDLLYVLENSAEDDWWKVKKKADQDDEEEPIGLVPNNYLEEVRKGVSQLVLRFPLYVSCYVMVAAYKIEWQSSIPLVLDAVVYADGLFAPFSRPNPSTRRKRYMTTRDKRTRRFPFQRIQSSWFMIYQTLTGFW
jgi:Variant SH3 domain